MLDKTSVNNKFSEFHAKYAGQDIDDFDTFVLARVIEYCINTEKVSTNLIYSLCDDVLNKPVTEDSVGNQSSCGAADAKGETGKPIETSAKKKAMLNSFQTRLKKTAPCIVGASTAVFTTVFGVKKRRKRKV